MWIAIILTLALVGWIIARSIPHSGESSEALYAAMRNDAEAWWRKMENVDKMKSEDALKFIDKPRLESVDTWFGDARRKGTSIAFRGRYLGFNFDKNKAVIVCDVPVYSKAEETGSAMLYCGVLKDNYTMFLVAGNITNQTDGFGERLFRGFRHRKKSSSVNSNDGDLVALNVMPTEITRPTLEEITRGVIMTIKGDVKSVDFPDR